MSNTKLPEYEVTHLWVQKQDGRSSTLCGLLRMNDSFTEVLQHFLDSDKPCPYCLEHSDLPFLTLQAIDEEPSLSRSLNTGYPKK